MNGKPQAPTYGELELELAVLRGAVDAAKQWNQRQHEQAEKALALAVRWGVVMGMQEAALRRADDLDRAAQAYVEKPTTGTLNTLGRASWAYREARGDPLVEMLKPHEKPAEPPPAEPPKRKARRR